DTVGVAAGYLRQRRPCERQLARGAGTLSRGAITSALQGLSNSSGKLRSSVERGTGTSVSPFTVPRSVPGARVRPGRLFPSRGRFVGFRPAADLGRMPA